METYHYRREPDDRIRIGIALSGGGLRSAAFNLGVLQMLQERGVLSRASHLAAVSGGNYIASAFMITAAMSDENTLADGVWRPGSEEERALRRDSTYLAAGSAGRAWLFANYLYGLILNIIPFLLCSFLAGRVLGLAYRSGLTPVVGVVDGGSARVLSLPAVVGFAVVAATGFAIVLSTRWREHRFATEDEDGMPRGGTWIGRLLVLALLLAAVLVIVPILVRWFRTMTDLANRAAGTVGVGYDERQARFVVAGLAILGLMALAGLSVWMIQRRVLPVPAAAMASIAGPLLLLVPCVMAADYGTSRSYRTTDTVLIVGALVVLAFFAVFVHNRRYSMHLFYRERLAAAFAVRRVDASAGVRNGDGPGPRVEARSLPIGDALCLTEVAERLEQRREAGLIQLPELIVCSAVNTSDRVVPPGQYAGSYTFEADESGGPLVGYSPTAALESRQGAGGTQLTLPSMMAISGAAISPLMGRFTLPPIRFLMAILNLRLGVWLPNPARAGEDAVGVDPSRPPGLLQRLRQGWYEPGALYVWREALGRARLNWRFIYVTDGGHWENLGVTELVRRRCNRILAFDAGAGEGSVTADLGLAISLARSELGAELRFDNEQLEELEQVENGQATRSHVTGRILYPEEGSSPGAISYARAQLVPDSSWDLRSYQRREPVFPGHPTSDQLFDGPQFESYRALGREVAARALEDFPMSLAASAETGASRPV